MELKFLHKTIQLEHNYGTIIQLRSVQVYPEKKNNGHKILTQENTI